MFPLIESSNPTTDLILLVDDEASNLDMLSRRLMKKGFDVVTALSAAEARKIMTSHKADIILLDIMMPGESGLDYLQELRADPKTAGVPVILVSALDQTEDVVKGLSLGANDYVPKPINFKILMARLQTQLHIGGLLKRLETQNTLLSELAVLDDLTGIYNRRMGNELMRRIILVSVRESSPLSVALFDIDFFKRINDTFGHLAGDAVLKQLAKRLTEAMRAADVLFRYGGEEFCAIFPDTPNDRAIQIANRLREIVGADPFFFEGIRIEVTTSIGVSTITPAEGSETEHWLKEADEALYAAKTAGRNRVVSSEIIKKIPAS